MNERRDVGLFYLAVGILAFTTLLHEALDPPTSSAEWVSNAAHIMAVAFLLTMTIFVFRPQIRRVSSSMALMQETMVQMRLLETVIEGANDGIIITKAELDNPGPEIIYVNKAFTEISGYSVEEAVGQSPRFLQSEFTKRETLDALRTALSRGEPFKDELLNKHKNGQSYWLDISIVPVKDQNGKITHFAAIERDITKRKQEELEQKNVWVQLKRANMKAEAATRDLQESLKKAEEANKAKGDFLANMSHELRTPMNGVLGMAQLLGDTQLNTEQKELVHTINSSGENLLMLLNDILDFSKIEAGALELEHAPFALHECVQATTNLLRSNAHKKGVDLIVDCDADVPAYIMGDSGRLRQVITNLIGNAIKFTEKGYVHLNAKTVDRDDKPCLQIRVEDTGIGIPEDKIASIFDKFTQADASVTRKYGGTGLGLAISKQLISLMGGTMGVESVVGKGSTFWFTIPCDVAAYCDIGEHLNTLSERQDRATGGKPIREARALLVEDYPVNRVFAEKLLRKFGFVHLDTAENGAEALLRYRSNVYDVIFMDCQMPEVDGYQATQKIRLMEEDTPLHTPIIAMTANAMMGDREKCLKSGMDDYISKPLRAQHLKSILQSLFTLEEENAGSAIGKRMDALKPQTLSLEPSEPAVDLEQLRMFTGGDANEERELTELFLEQAQAMISLLKESLAPDKRDAWKSAAHRFKGASGNFGAMKLHHLCKRAESHYEDSPEQKSEMLTAINAAATQVQIFMQQQAA